MGRITAWIAGGTLLVWLAAHAWLHTLGKAEDTVASTIEPPWR